MPTKFMKKKAHEEGVDLPEIFGIGVVFTKDDELLKVVEEKLQNNDLKVVLTRKVPVNKVALGELALKTLPNIYHLFIVPNSLVATKRFEEMLYLSRREIENSIDDEDF
jgi:glutamate synthase (NADPH/NADH) large chain